MWRVGRGQEPWERSEASGPGLDLHCQSLLLLSFRSSSVGLETVAQVSLIITNSTGLALLPRLSAPPHSSQVGFNKTNQNTKTNQNSKPKQTKPNQTKTNYQIKPKQKQKTKTKHQTKIN